MNTEFWNLLSVDLKFGAKMAGFREQSWSQDYDAFIDEHRRVELVVWASAMISQCTKAQTCNFLAWGMRKASEARWYVTQDDTSQVQAFVCLDIITRLTPPPQCLYVHHQTRMNISWFINTATINCESCFDTSVIEDILHRYTSFNWKLFSKQININEYTCEYISISQ